MSNLFDKMGQCVDYVECHIDNPGILNEYEQALFALGALRMCITRLHDIDHDMEGALSRHPSADALRRRLDIVLRESEDNNDE